MASNNAPRRAACTIIARNYIAQATLLATSYLKHHPNDRFFVLVVDGAPDGVNFGQSVTVLGPDDLRLPQFLEMAFKYDVTELSTAVKPTLMSAIMRDFEVDQVAYFDPDVIVFRPLEEMWAQLEQANVLLIPHLLDPIPLDGCRPSEQDILIAGAYNLGFIGLRKSAEVDRLLEWWHERLIDHCRVDVAGGLFVDQKWMDLTPSLFTGVSILRDETYDVAYWNLHSRHLQRTGDDVLVNGRPLGFFHYSGFDPASPRELSKHQNRITVGEGTSLAFLLDKYSQAMHQAGHAFSRLWPYRWAIFDNSLAISRLHRSLYAGLPAEQRSHFGNPFESGPDSFLEWSSRPPADGLSRLMEHLLAKSLEARVAFPEAQGNQQKAFLSWAQTHGVDRFGYDPRLADPAAWPELQSVQVRDGLNGAARAPLGVNVLGYLRNETGLGAVARGFVGALQSLGVPLGLRDLSELSPNRSQDESLGRIDGTLPYGINIVCVNADQHFVVKSHVGDDVFRDHYNIGVWFWELPTFPDEWRDRLPEYDEIWACSSYIANTLAQVSPVPIVRMPPVLAGTGTDGSRDAGRARLGVRPTTHVFLFVFDFASYFERKNPLALIEAFKRAFAKTEDVRLVIKCVNEHLDHASFQRMQSAAGDHPISIYTGYWTSNEMRDLTQACDAYVSLHRSEGLGVPIANAMALGKPAIATDWSGNTDFMTVGNSFPVPFDLVKLENNLGPYPAGAWWASPRVDEAARLMRLVRDEPELAQARGDAARRDMEVQYSRSSVADALKQRLALIAGIQGLRRASATQTERQEARRPIARLAPVVPPMDLSDSSHGTAGVAMKHAMNFLLRYHNHYQGEVNLAFAAFMRQLAEEHDAQAAEVKTLAPRGQVAAVEAQIRDIVKGMSALANDVARHEMYFSARPYMAADAYETSRDLAGAMGYGEDGRALAVAPGSAGFAELFRGSEEFIADRQRVYLQFFKGDTKVLDLGSGRGEFLELLCSQGIEAVGVELDPAMVEQSRNRGLHVELADAYEYLQQLAPESVDVIFSAQFIEHVESSQLQGLIDIAYSRLRPRGLFIAETVNPESHLALKTFFVDLTHQRPIFPQVVLHICQTAGFPSARIFYPTAGGFTQAHYRDAGEYAVIAEK